MKLISVQDLKAQLSGAIAEAEAGETWVVTRHNQPVAQLGPAVSSHVHAGTRDVAHRLTPAVARGTKGRYLAVLLGVAPPDSAPLCPALAIGAHGKPGHGPPWFLAAPIPRTHGADLGCASRDRRSRRRVRRWRMTNAYEMPVRASTKGDEHWQRWIAKGETHDRAVENRTRMVGLAIASSVAIWFAATWSLR